MSKIESRTSLSIGDKCLFGVDYELINEIEEAQKENNYLTNDIGEWKKLSIQQSRDVEKLQQENKQLQDKLESIYDDLYYILFACEDIELSKIEILSIISKIIMSKENKNEK